MYSIEKTNYGVKLVFGGMIPVDEMAKWVEESIKFVPSLPSSFGVLIDMRSLKPLQDDAKNEMTKGQILYKSKGMKRSAVILDSAILIMQFKRIAKETGIYEWERYFNASDNPSWEQSALDWLVKGVDPDL